MKPASHSTSCAKDGARRAGRLRVAGVAGRCERPATGPVAPAVGVDGRRGSRGGYDRYARRPFAATARNIGRGEDGVAVAGVVGRFQRPRTTRPAHLGQGRRSAVRWARRPVHRQPVHVTRVGAVGAGQSKVSQSWSGWRGSGGLAVIVSSWPGSPSLKADRFLWPFGGVRRRARDQSARWSPRGPRSWGRGGTTLRGGSAFVRLDTAEGRTSQRGTVRRVRRSPFAPQARARRLAAGRRRWPPALASSDLRGVPAGLGTPANS